MQEARTELITSGNGEWMPAPPPASAVWDGVYRLVDRAPRLSDLRRHGLHLLAARRWHRLGREVPLDLRRQERAAAIFSLVATNLLGRIRAICDGPIVLMKGPEVAARYPDPALRPFRDLDLLLPDAPAAQRALVAAGFEPAGDPELYVGIHHLRPLLWPGLPLLVELHERPKWLEGAQPPPTQELVARALPSATGVDGILTLRPAEHALVLAAHSWAHVPLGRIIHLIDIAAMAEEVDANELASVAREWGMTRVWRSTSAAADAVLLGRRTPTSLRTWARNLVAVRERTVLGSHLESWLSPWWALPSRQALPATASAVADEFRPRPDETWRMKLRRTGHAFRDAFERTSDHDEALERAGVPPRPKGGAR